MSANQQDLIAQIAAQQLGAPPQAAPQGQPAPQPQGAPAPPQVAAKLNVPDVNTPADTASTAGAPQDAGAKMGDDPILYEVDFGDAKRKLTPAQIKSTFERYRDLNFTHANMKPVLEVAQAIIQQNPGTDPGKLAEYMMAVAKGQQPNPTFGGDKQPQQQPQGSAKPGPQPDIDGDDDDSALAEWEKENAATLPPGYKQMRGSQKQMMQALLQTQQMLQQVLAGTQGVADASRAVNQDARTTQASAIRQRIGVNLDRAQAAAGLPDDAAQDFMVFASERGYTMEDFIDPGLTSKVMQDYANSRNSPEMERMRQIAQRRQAFIGSMGQNAVAPAPAAPAGQDATLEGLINSTMQQRMMK